MFARVVAATLVLATSACSYLMIDRPPRAVRKTDVFPECTSSRTWPVIDAVAAVVGVAGGIGIATGAIKNTKMNEDGTTTREPLTQTQKVILAPTAIVEGLLFAWSGYYGYRTTDECSELRARLGASVAVPMPAPAPALPGGVPQ